MYVRKEAVLSSMIEGTQSSLSDLLLFELDMEPGVPLDDVREVSNYVAALDYGLKRLAEGFPLSLRLIKEVHGVLLYKGRGSNQTPGEFRRTQNWIGGTRPGNAAFVPPPADKVLECMGKLELFLHDQPQPTPALLKAALAHVQFETIHPFLDGNGRLGRLLITLLLCEQKMLREPMLYLSLYFKSHRQYYYELLNGVRLSGNWEAWLDFFAEAVIVTATQAVDTARQLIDLANEDRERISGLGRAAASTLRVHRALLERPITASGWLVKKTGITPATVNKCLRHLERLGIARELTSRRRNRVFSYTGILEIMNQGTELPG
jgi:Fic family protein